MMHLTKGFHYTVSDDRQVLELPYQGDALSMVVVLPEAGTASPLSSRA